MAAPLVARTLFDAFVFMATMLVIASASHAAAAPSSHEAKPSPGKMDRRASPPAKRRAAKLDLSVRPPIAEPKPGPGDPRFTGAIGAGVADAGADRPPSASASEAYRTQPLFESEQRLQILDVDVPVSVKLGKWKSAEDTRALGLSATVPLAGAD